MRRILNNGMPSKKGITTFTKKMITSLFPFTEGGKCNPDSFVYLRFRLLRLLRPMKERLPDTPGKITALFFDSLADIREQMEKDAALIAESDPAASGIEEVVMTYPGFYAILVYRLANRLALSGVPLIPRVMTEHAHSLTGIDIHPKATIDSPFFIDHGTGIVIGETAIIGSRVKLYQGVTIGALSVSKEMACTKRHPTIEDNVIIYAGSTILGGDTVIGHDSIIGGNVWLTKSIPPFSLVYHENIMKVRELNNSSL
jgi:serine O-acetyltransferase